MSDEQRWAGPTVEDLPPDMRLPILQRLEGVRQESRRGLEAALVRDAARERGRMLRRGGPLDTGPLAIIDPNSPGSASYEERHRETRREVMPGMVQVDSG